MSCKRLAIGGLLAASSLAISSAAQGPLAALAGQTQAPAEAVSVRLTPAQMPPVPPHVSYVDGQLTIIAENCSLGDILAAVRKLTAVQIDLPASASSERMAAREGPGRPREVLVSLLSSTDFNYILQTADDDPNEVQSVLLTPRDKKSSANNDPSGMSARMQRPPNHRPVEQAEEVARPEIPAPSQPSDTADASPATPAMAQPARLPQGELKLASASDANQQPLSPSEQMMQGMQRLYEQRRQMIQEQNLLNPKPPSSN